MLKHSPSDAMKRILCLSPAGPETPLTAPAGPWRRSINHTAVKCTQQECDAIVPYDQVAGRLDPPAATTDLYNERTRAPRRGSGNLAPAVIRCAACKFVRCGTRADDRATTRRRHRAPTESMGVHSAQIVSSGRRSVIMNMRSPVAIPELPR
jgi:hypothetical protein